MTSARKTLITIGAAFFMLAGVDCRRAPPRKEKEALLPPPQSASAEALTIASANLAESAEPGAAAAPSSSAAQEGGSPDGQTNKKPRGPRQARFLLAGPEEPIAMGGAATVFSKGIVWRLSGNAASVSLFGPKGPAPGPSEPERSKKWRRGKVSVAEDGPGAMHAYWIQGSQLIRNTPTSEGKL